MSDQNTVKGLKVDLGGKGYTTDTLPESGGKDLACDKEQQTTGSGAPATTFSDPERNTSTSINSLSLPSPKKVAAIYAGVTSEVDSLDKPLARRLRALWATLIQASGSDWSTASLPLSGEESSDNDFVGPDQTGKLPDWYQHEPKATQVDNKVASVQEDTVNKTSNKVASKVSSQQKNIPDYYVKFTDIKTGKTKIASIQASSIKEAQNKVKPIASKILQITKNDPRLPTAWKSLVNEVNSVNVSGKVAKRSYAIKPANYGKTVELIAELADENGRPQPVGSVSLSLIDEDSKTRRASVEVTDGVVDNEIHNIRFASKDAGPYIQGLVTKMIKAVKLSVKG